MFGLRNIIVATAIVSLVGASTTAIAARPAPIAASTAAAAGSWGTLSVMTGSSAATAALRSDDDREGGFGDPALLSLAVILGTIALAIYILTRDDDDKLDFNPIPVSPA